MLKIYETYAPRANPPDANYPLGSVKNVTVPGAKDGTPLDNKWGNNTEGFHQALLAEADIAANGQIERVGSSQLVEAIKAISYPSLATYSLLRAYTGIAKKLNIGGRLNYFDKANGNFYLDSSDTTSQDNDGTVIIDGAGRRWKRSFSGAVQGTWFGLLDQSTADLSQNFVNAFNASKQSTLNIEGTVRFYTPAVVEAYDEGVKITGNTIIEWYGSSGIALKVTGYGLDFENIRFNLKATGANTSTALWFMGQRSSLTNIKVFGGFGTCIDLSQTKESTLNRIHIENYLTTPDNRKGVGIRWAHCLNTQLTNSYVGYCSTAMNNGTEIPGVTHSNEGITIESSTIIANDYQIFNLGGLAININNNIVDLTKFSAIYLTGQNHKVCGNWIADDSDQSRSGYILLNISECIYVDVDDNTFWRGAFEAGSGLLTGITVNNGIGQNIRNNTFTGKISSTINLNNSNAIYGNRYARGATPISNTGSSALLSCADPQTKLYHQQGMKLGTPSTIDATLSIFGADGIRGISVQNYFDVPMLKTGITNRNIVANYNAAESILFLSKDEATQRSINAAGTINAAGADYAEYIKKSDGCGEIKKGDLCGIDKNGFLTDKFDESISFVIKSTNPSICGADDWGDSLVKIDGESDDDFSKRHDAIRSKYDRIAFAGRVPVNTYSCNPGDYVFPVRNEDGSIGLSSSKIPTIDQYMNSVGKVWSKLNGKTIVAVKIS